MIITMENKFGITNKQINIPFMANNIPIGVVTKVTEGEITILVWDRYIGIEKEYETGTNILDLNRDSKVSAICMGGKIDENSKINMFGLNE